MNGSKKTCPTIIEGVFYKMKFCSEKLFNDIGFNPKKIICFGNAHPNSFFYLEYFLICISFCTVNWNISEVHGFTTIRLKS